MTPEAILERLLRENDLGWLIDIHTSPERAIAILLDQLAQLSTMFRGRFDCEVSFLPEALMAEAEHNPHKIRAFLQAFAATGNLNMLLMVWRILEGRSIREVVMNYHELDKFSLKVTLGSLGEAWDEDEPETYETDAITDIALVSHFGVAFVNNLPLFDGFFPSRKK